VRTEVHDLFHDPISLHFPNSSLTIAENIAEQIEQIIHELVMIVEKAEFNQLENTSLDYLLELGL